MSLDAGEAASETGDDSLSAVTFESDLETKVKRKSFRKPSAASPKSPYQTRTRKVASWRPLRAAASMPVGARASLTPQKLWLSSSKQASLAQPLRSDLASEHPWTSPPRDTPDHLVEALRMKRATLRRSASNGHTPGTPVYREKEDMYDEIIELKKSLHVQKSDVDLMRTKLRRLEEENSRKDRQIEQLLDPSRGPEFVRTLAEKRPDAGWVINGLKQRILKLEQQCKDKDSTISKLQCDMKATNLEEMRVAMETYYEEIHRLQTLLASSDTTGRKLPGEKKAGLRRQKKAGTALLSLSRSVRELTEENQSLKEDLDRLLSSSPTVCRAKGYVEWSKPRLLRRIAELEKKLSPVEASKSHAPDPPAPSASSPAAHGQSEETERLRSAVKSLRSERSALQSQLLEKDGEVRQLLQTKADLQRELDALRGGEPGSTQQEQALRREVQTLLRKVQALQERVTAEHEEPVEGPPEAPEEPCAPSLPRAADSGPSTLSRPPSCCSDGRQDAAAGTLQAHWKAHRHEAAVVLQAAFRGHLARVNLLAGTTMPQRTNSPRLPAKSPQDQGQEEAVTIIQSVLRAHLARAGPSPSPCSTASLGAVPSVSQRRPAIAASPELPLASLEAAGEDGEVSSGQTARGSACPGWPAPSDSSSSDDSDEVVMPPPVPRTKTTALA
ncbi:IQ domain-containing protein E isoform X2 [Sorex araneus]|uniref:IQ domain-containing protein E isoform X2 n=1 Tax=Sorex araneus TaxID=42254 RepID=UPI002433EBC3|nr:IQ domain-containing protein E isoform X2 [Sorex araneus]